MRRSAVGLCIFLLLAGCAQSTSHCEPLLDAVSVVATFPIGFTQDNRSVARAALEDMGFALPSDTDDRLEMIRFRTTVLVAGDGLDTIWRYEFDVGERYPSTAEASRAADEHVPDTWSGFNATLNDFEERTGWTAHHRGTPGPVVAPCI